jgi:hypothetical protein
MRTRRQFLQSSLRASVVLGATGALRPSSLFADPQSSSPGKPTPDVKRSPMERFSDVRQHFVFEYYPWYGGPPRWFHWDQWDRVPPLDLASNYVPRLGAYESGSRAVIEQHARWIAGAGVGAISYSWWGQGSFEDRNVHTVMDVMKDHGIKVAFHLEPYADNRGERWSDDVIYILREYGERRRFDAMLLLRDADGSTGPVFKGFGTILPEKFVDCHGIEQRVSEYTRDSTWRSENDGLRDTLRRDFDHITFLCDTTDFRRAAASGFDGIAIYDPFVPPERYAGLALGASQAGLLFSFNVNPGFDSIVQRRVEPDSCYQPLPFAPATTGLTFETPDGRELAAQRAEQRIVESFTEAMAQQTNPKLLNARQGFLLVYVTSFNEWHEGHMFEPMADAEALSDVERAFGYHNPQRGDYRLATLSRLLKPIVQPGTATAAA